MRYAIRLIKFFCFTYVVGLLIFALCIINVNLALWIVAMFFTASLNYAGMCTEKCQARYYDFVEAQKAQVGHWGAAENSPMRCPDNAAEPRGKCRSDFYVCRDKCNGANWDVCITACWNSLQDCCFDNVMSNAESLRQECISQCNAQINDAPADALPAAFKDASLFGGDTSVCITAVLLLMFAGAGYAFMHTK